MRLGHATSHGTATGLRWRPWLLAGVLALALLASSAGMPTAADEPAEGGDYGLRQAELQIQGMT